MELSIKSDAKNGKQNQKWFLPVNEILRKIGLGFISNFLLKARVLFLTTLKLFKLTFQGWNRPVCRLFGFTRVSVCQNLLHFTLGQWCESWPCWCRVSFSVVFLFSASFKNSSPRERSGIVSVLGLVVGVSVSIHYGREISEYFSPR